MRELGINQIREEFLKFFESKGHLRLKSFPLVPQDDHSLLLINSGMAPMKKWFLRQDTPPRVRVTTCQKCIRTPDIERVGKTARHGTFFEMLGNFSFGEYFKEEATEWAWEFLTGVLEIPIEKLWVSIYQDDDEAYSIWKDKRGVDPSRIVRLGKEDNFWEIGSGPCGPCSEIYYDRGEEKGCGKESCGVGCDCDRYVEIWNLVFSQFNGDGEGHYIPMEHPNIDTGMGLERLGCILQGVDNLFEVDTVQAIIQKVGRLAGVTYGEDPKKDVSIRVITDHIRGSVFLISDGVIPGNEGREYVLRRLIRRAQRNGKQLGIRTNFLEELADTVIEENAPAYPELKEHAEYIKKILRAEEESFNKVLGRGMQLLDSIIDRMDSHMEEQRVIPGEQIFMLCDTYGFPVDLIREIASERSLKIDEEKYQTLLESQRKRARKAAMGGNAVAWEEKALKLNSPATQFVGYNQDSCEATVLELFEGQNPIKEAESGRNVQIVLDKTPFYAQSGGQVADTGFFKTEQAEVLIENCQKTADGHFVHQGKVTKGTLKAGEAGILQIDAYRRAAITRNHTAAHLLQRALREVLGNHVHQAGQLVDDHRVRFDFNHFGPMTPSEIAQVECIVNEKILEGLPVSITEMSRDEAQKIGAMALFNEKYGDRVRVVNAGDYSIELCGGCHVDTTSKLGLFKIISESSAAAGIRRIEAITGTGVLSLLNEQSALLSQIQKDVKTAEVEEIPSRVQGLLGQIKEKERQIEKLQSKMAGDKIKNLLSEPSCTINGIEIYSANLGDTPMKTLREMGDRFKQEDKPVVALLASAQDSKGNLVAAVSKKGIALNLHAGKIVNEAASFADGKGGGRPDSATAGINSPSKIDEVFRLLPSIIEKMVAGRSE